MSATVEGHLWTDSLHQDGRDISLACSVEEPRRVLSSRAMWTSPTAMSTLLQGSSPSLLAANNTTTQPLAATTPASPSPQPHLAAPTSRWRTISRISFAGWALLVKALTLVCLLFSCFQRRSMWVPPASPSIPLSSGKRIFALEEVRKLTNDFSLANLRGRGCFGFVYHGVLSNGKEVAVKRLMGGSNAKELGFEAEVKTVGCIQHGNIVSLVGFCIDGPERVLVYDYVPNGSLEFRLHGDGQPTLAWKVRMGVAVGCANGLAYLHEHCIVHCDIKPDNILLSSEFEPKIADFGLAKFTSESNHRTSGGVQTPSSDTLLFGIVLLELVTGCKHQILSAFSMRPHLAQALKDGNFDSLVDPRLQNDYIHSEMTRMVACAAASLRELPQHRLRMSEIAQVLEGHQSAANLDDGIRAGPSNLDLEYGNAHYGEATGECGRYPSGSSGAGPSRQTLGDLEMGMVVFDSS